MDTTLSILKMLLLCFIILDFNGDHVTSHSIHTEFFFLTFELIFIIYSEPCISKDIQGSEFHCLHYIKKLSYEKHLFYKRIKNCKLRNDLSDLQAFYNLYKEYRVLSDYIISNTRRIIFKKLIHSIRECILKNEAQHGWSRLKKISKPSFSPSQSPVYIKDKVGNLNILLSQEDQFNFQKNLLHIK